MSKKKPMQPIPPLIGSVNVLFRLPTQIEKLLKCPLCNLWLIRIDTGWTCPCGAENNVGHMGIKSDNILLGEIDEEVTRIYQLGRYAEKKVLRDQSKTEMCKLLLELLWHRSEMAHRKTKPLDGYPAAR
jgi:hypothetical protein